MTIYEWQRHFIEQLKDLYPLHEASVISSMILESMVAITKADIIKYPNQTLSLAEEHTLANALSELLIHKPVQYVMGFTWFNHLKLKVNEHVLIPRPETEEMIQMLNKDFFQSSDLQILDIGSGSGCIPISIKKSNPSFLITSIDISPSAMKVAQENAISNAAEITFKQTDFLDQSTWNSLDIYDIIVSNPPYIPESDMSSMNKNVLSYEPHQALFVNESNPLVFYEAIMQFGKSHLHTSGKIYLEIHESFGDEIESLFRKNGYVISIKKDLFDKDRFAIASLCQ